jgi:hypothetical protein
MARMMPKIPGFSFTEMAIEPEIIEQSPLAE